MATRWSVVVEVWAEVVGHDGDPDLGRMEGAEVADEGQELGPALGRGDVPVEAVGCEVVAGHEVPDPVRPGVGGSTTSATGNGLIASARGHRGPLLAGVGLEVEGPNSSMQITTVGSVSPGWAVPSAMA
jgi:hypothetical protein